MSFPIYLDEDVDVHVAALLKQSGFDVLTTLEAGRANKRISDEDQLAFAVDQGRAIFTHNVKDFFVLASKWEAAGRSHCGIVVAPHAFAPELAERWVLMQQVHPNGLSHIQYLVTLD